VIWYRVRTVIRSWAIVIIVLLLHGALVYLLLVEFTKHESQLPAQRIVESAPVYFTNDEPTTVPMANKPKPIPAQPDPLIQQSSSVLRTTADRQKPEPIKPEPLQQETPPQKDLLFASLYQKETEPDVTEDTETTDNMAPEPEPEPEESPITDPLTIINEVDKKVLTPDSIAPKKVSRPPLDVATDDIPIAFEGSVHTTQLSARDSLFHTFIKAVNTALYKSMSESTPPFTPGIQPVAVRMVIVRTGRLAQRPTIIRSTGNPTRDAWYVDAIVRASASFPPIPDGLHLPFAEMIFKEGSRGGKL
jgi:hypothetical protein